MNPWYNNQDGSTEQFAGWKVVPQYSCVYDPNDPAWIADPNLADPNLSEGWYEWKYRCNLDAAGDSAYTIDFSDLLIFADDNIWLWVACWRHDIQDMQQQSMMMGGSQQMMMTSVPSTSLESLQSTETSIPAMAESVEIIPTTEPIEPEEFNPAVERANILSLLEDIDALIAAGGDDTETWQEIKNLLEQSLVDTEDTINDPNEI